VFRVLDVGCGRYPHGDVNVDLYPMETEHRLPPIGREGLGEPLDVKSIQNFIRADACHLPFKSDAFEVVFSSHVIEHVAYPLKMIKEMLRVSRNKVVIKCPHRLNRKGKIKVHKHYFNIGWFDKLFKKWGLPCRAEVSRWLYIPYRYMPLIQLPLEIKVEILKREALKGMEASF